MTGRIRIKQTPRREHQKITDLTKKAKVTDFSHLEDLSEIEIENLVKILKHSNTRPNSATKVRQKKDVTTKR
ncbi:MAG: hypothetical protein WCX82_01750 [archaeon]|jgi:uncharacterized caspase-like protein